MARERSVGVSLVREMAKNRVVVGVLNEVEPSEQFLRNRSYTVRSGVNPLSIEQSNQDFGLAQRFPVHERVVEVDGKRRAGVNPEAHHDDRGVEAECESGQHGCEGGAESKLAKHEKKDSSHRNAPAKGNVPTTDQRLGHRCLDERAHVGGKARTVVLHAGIRRRLTLNLTLAAVGAHWR